MSVEIGSLRMDIKEIWEISIPVRPNFHYSVTDIIYLKSFLLPFMPLGIYFLK